MNKYNDLELSILSCLLLKPELMEEIVLEDKHFVKQQKLWQFMKAFYKKFGNFDLTLMYSISKDKYRIVQYMMWLLDKEPSPTLFYDYQKQIIALYNETKKEKWVIEKAFELSNELYVRNISIKKFDEELQKIYINADKLFDNEN